MDEEDKEGKQDNMNEEDKEGDEENDNVDIVSNLNEWKSIY